MDDSTVYVVIEGDDFTRKELGCCVKFDSAGLYIRTDEESMFHVMYPWHRIKMVTRIEEVRAEPALD